MPVKQGKYTLSLPSAPSVAGYAAVVGKKEGEGPLGAGFDYVYDDAAAGQKSWEKAESTMHGDAVNRALTKAGVTADGVDVAFAGDLLDQCIGSSFALRDSGMPFVGLYGACSTMALSLAAAAVCVDARIADIAVASTSSHFCSAEKQFRMPLEYGGQRTPTAQWTATAAGACLVRAHGSAGVPVLSVTFGRGSRRHFESRFQGEDRQGDNRQDMRLRGQGRQQYGCCNGSRRRRDDSGFPERHGDEARGL